MESSATDRYYEKGYHSTHFKALITDEDYFQARAVTSTEFYFKPEERARRIFDYGCGIGHAIATLPNAAGWDVSPEAREACRRRKLAVYDDLAEVPKAEWEIVFCRHVLEHLERPLDTLRSMRDLVAPGGELYLILPKEEFHTPRIAPDINQHLYSWNFQAINNLLFRAGYTPYVNEFRYMLGWKALMPVRKALGQKAYFQLTKLGGLLKRNGELVVRARLA